MRIPSVAICLLALALPAGAQAGDRDRDGMPNAWERKHRLPAGKPDGARDSDRDGASNLTEYRKRTNPRRRDTDRDHLADGYELKRSRTSPRWRDSDRDRVPDGAEDFDRDGLSTATERKLYTFPRHADTDDDTLADGDEVARHRTDPLDPDTDGDGWTDARELRLGSAPLQAASKPRKPETKIASAPSPVTPATTAPFRFESPVPAPRFECRLNGGAWGPCPAAATFGVHDGRHSLEVRAVNAEGWVDETPATVTWTVDTVVPVITLAARPGAFLRSTTAAFTFSTEAGATAECRLDGGSWRNCGSPRYETGLAQGAHSWQVRARDAAGNVSAPVSAPTFTVDTIRPNTFFTSTPSGGDVTFGFEATEQASFECRIDSGSYAPCSSPTSYTGLSVGWHTFRVRAVDEAGNRDGSPATWAFHVAS